MKHLTDTAFWDDLCHGIVGPRSGGARIIVDAEDAATGVGKTSLAVHLARLLAKAFGYNLTYDDCTLSGAEYLERWREHPDAHQPSVLVLDELAGAGAGDARRAMSHQNVNLGRAWQLMRKKRIITITTLAHWSDADSKLQRFADYRCWCQRRPIGTFVPYRITAGFDDGAARTDGYDDVSRIHFPNLDAHGDPIYQHLAERKDELLNSDTYDADNLGDDADEPTPDDVERERKMADAQRAREQGLSTREVAAIVDMSQAWVVNNTEAPEAENDAEATTGD